MSHAVFCKFWQVSQLVRSSESTIESMGLVKEKDCIIVSSMGPLKTAKQNVSCVCSDNAQFEHKSIH